MERSFPSGTMHGRHVRNVHAFHRTHRRTHSRSLYLCTCAHMCCVLWLRSCVFTTIDRPSSYTHLSTCHYMSGTSVLCTVTLVKMTVSADARGYITRPIHATLIMAGIVPENRAFRSWAGFNLLLRQGPFRSPLWRRSPSWHKTVMVWEEL